MSIRDSDEAVRAMATVHLSPGLAAATIVECVIEALSASGAALAPATVALQIPLTLVAIAPLPFVYLVGVRLRNRVFPLQWVVTARQAELATIVDESTLACASPAAEAEAGWPPIRTGRAAVVTRWGTSAPVATPVQGSRPSTTSTKHIAYLFAARL